MQVNLAEWVVVPVLKDIDLWRPLLVGRRKPESRPQSLAEGNLGGYLHVAILEAHARVSGNHSRSASEFLVPALLVEAGGRFALRDQMQGTAADLILRSLIPLLLGVARVTRISAAASGPWVAGRPNL